MGSKDEYRARYVAALTSLQTVLDELREIAVAVDVHEEGSSLGLLEAAGMLIASAGTKVEDAQRWLRFWMTEDSDTESPLNGGQE